MVVRSNLASRIAGFFPIQPKVITRRLLSVLLFISMVLCSSNWLYAQQTGNGGISRKTEGPMNEVSVLWVVPYPAVAISAGRYLFSSAVEFEATAFLEPSDIVMLGGISLHIPSWDKRNFTPFGTIGWGPCIHGVLFNYYGGGVKIRPAGRIGIRAAFVQYVDDVSGSHFLFGLSFPF